MWGRLVAGTDSGDFGAKARPRFKGALWFGDAGVELYYMRNRWYEPKSGRFLAEDPLGVEAGLNQYVFAMDDPVGRRDPTGLDVCIDKNLPQEKRDSLIGVIKEAFGSDFEVDEETGYVKNPTPKEGLEGFGELQALFAAMVGDRGTRYVYTWNKPLGGWDDPWTNMNGGFGTLVGSGGYGMTVPWNRGVYRTRLLGVCLPMGTVRASHPALAIHEGAHAWHYHSTGGSPYSRGEARERVALRFENLYNTAAGNPIRCGR